MKRVLLLAGKEPDTILTVSRHAPLAQAAEGVIPEDTRIEAILRKMRFPFDSGRARD